MATSSRTSSVRKKGYVFKLPVSGGVLKVWAKRWAVLHSTTHEGILRFEYYDNQEAEVRGEHKRVILLRNCTGCIETTEFKSRPFAFQFSTHLGRHVFAVDSKLDLDSWVDCINDVIREDRMKTKKNMKKNSLAESVRREPIDSTGHVPHVGTLMGVYNVAINPTDLSRALNLSGTYSLDVTPKGMSIISNATETEVVKWHFRHIKFYAKSSKNIVTLEMGQRSPTGSGTFLFQTTVAKELFSMIHRNIKKIKMTIDKKAKEEDAREVERIRETRQRKNQELSQRQAATTMRPKSLSTELDDHRPRQSRTPFRHSATLDPFQSASTIGTVADDDLIHLEGLAGYGDDMDDGTQEDMTVGGGMGGNFPNLAMRNRLSMGHMLEDKLELDSLNQLTPVVYGQVPATSSGTRTQSGSSSSHLHSPQYHQQQLVNTQPIYDQPRPDHIQQGFGDSFTNIGSTANTQTVHRQPLSFDKGFQESFTDGPIYDQPPPAGFGDSFVPTGSSTTAPDPFSNVTDPFQTSARGSFYNAEEDIFQSFDQIPSSPNRTSTPNTDHIYSNTGELKAQGNPPLYPQHHLRPSQEPTYSNVAEAVRGLKDIQLDTKPRANHQGPIPKPRTLNRGATKEQLDNMWGDIEKDFNFS